MVTVLACEKVQRPVPDSISWRNRQRRLTFAHSPLTMQTANVVSPFHHALSTVADLVPSTSLGARRIDHSSGH